MWDKLAGGFEKSRKTRKVWTKIFSIQKNNLKFSEPLREACCWRLTVERWIENVNFHRFSHGILWTWKWLSILKSVQCVRRSRRNDSLHYQKLICLNYCAKMENRKCYANFRETYRCKISLKERKMFFSLRLVVFKRTT